MAVIGKIRQRSGLLIFIIGASIVGFLVMDATNQQTGVLSGGRKTSVGKVNGTDISIQDYEKKYDENVKNMEEQMRGQGINEEMRNNLRGMTWEQIVNESIFDKVYEKLGINVTTAEMAELLSSPENAHPYVRQNFSNPQTGQFDPGYVKLFVQNLDKDEPGTEQGTKRNQWKRFEDGLKKDQYQRKYENLIAKGLYTPTWLGEMAYNDQTRMVDFKYVQLPFTDINDADVKVGDDDIQNYINKHKARFKNEDETRKIQYVTFDIAASSADSFAIMRSLDEKRADFAKGEKVGDDSVFVKLYSETAFDDVYYTKDNLNSPIKDSLFNLPVKSVVGPYLDGNSFKLAKISDRKLIADSVRVRDIAFSFQGLTSQEQAQALHLQIDSVLRQIDSLKGDFAAFAMAFSSDQMSKMTGGDIGWVKPNQKTPDYNNLVFYRAQKGKTYKVIVPEENTVHLVQVVDEKASKQGVLVTYLSREITASPETEKAIYAAAQSFAAENQTEAKFKAAGQKANMKSVADLRSDAFSIPGLGNARQVVKWAFTAEKGTISTIFALEKKHAIVLLEGVNPKGVKSVDEVRDFVKTLVIKEKKVELLSKKIEDAKASNIDDLAGKLGKPALQVSAASFTNANMGGFYEPVVVAAALNSPVNKLSKPVEGGTGVFAVQTISVQEPPKASDYSIYTMQYQQRNAGKARMAGEVQKKLSKIDDHRSDFF